MKTCLLTGATGLIGGRVAGALLKEGWEIYAVARSAPPTPHPSLHHLPINLSTCIPQAQLPAQVDAVIHLAQSEYFRQFPDKAVDMFQVNVMSTMHLLDYARQHGAKHFILASSGGIYGHHEEGFREDETVKASADLGFYLNTKLCAEMIAEHYAAYMNVVMLRFFFVYGNGQRKSMLIPRLVQSVQEGRAITLQEQDGIRINPTHVSDAAAAIVQALTLASSQKINVGGPDVLSLRQIGEIIGQALGREPIFQVEADVPARHLVGNIQKMTNLLGAPRLHFTDGIRLLLAQQSDHHD
jgi:nucleoside-diphosphate-sugar epimerase